MLTDKFNHDHLMLFFYLHLPSCLTPQNAGNIDWEERRPLDRMARVIWGGSDFLDTRIEPISFGVSGRCWGRTPPRPDATGLVDVRRHVRVTVNSRDRHSFSMHRISPRQIVFVTHDIGTPRYGKTK